MPFLGAFRVEELTGDRWALALDRLRDGEMIVVFDVRFWLGKPGIVTATAASAWSDLSCVSADSAIEDLRRADAVLAALREQSPEFVDEVGDRRAELEVVVDYDTGTVLMARSVGGAMQWADGRPLAGDS